MKKVKALKQFYGSFDEGMNEDGKKWATSPQRAKELEKAGFVEILGDTEEEPEKKELLINNGEPMNFKEEKGKVETKELKGKVSDK